MPLSPPAEREPIHSRDVVCRGYRRADGLWDIEGRVTDTKTYAFPNSDRGTVEAGEPVHDMWVRLTVDDDLLIHEAEAVSDYYPFRACPTIAPDFSALAGLRIRPGFTAEVRRRLGGVKGCTHLVELLGPVATTAFQTVFPARERRAAANPDGGQPGHIDTCHALRSDGEVVRRNWPAFYTGPQARREG